MACSGGRAILRDVSGTFTSPNYPYNYANYESCQWLISGPDGTKVYYVSVAAAICARRHRSGFSDQ